MADIFINSDVNNTSRIVRAVLNIFIMVRGIVDVFVEPGHIRNVIDTKIDDMQINGLISSAIILVKERLGEHIVQTPVGLEIIKWLTAHFISLIDNPQRVTREKVGDLEIDYSDVDAKVQLEIGLGGILSTRWGRVAAAMDQSGSLAKAGGPPIKLYAL